MHVATTALRLFQNGLRNNFLWEHVPRPLQFCMLMHTYKSDTLPKFQAMGLLEMPYFLIKLLWQWRS